MKTAILSDIHSNVFALQAVFHEMDTLGIDQYLLLGDTFGYYPWAAETYHLLQKKHCVAAIKGNHDELVLEDPADENLMQSDYFQIALHNRNDLMQHAPQALIWLKNLKSEMKIRLGKYKCFMVHGTPDDTLNGRFYPDNQQMHDWFPKSSEVLMMGHTHYPINNLLKDEGRIFNPGSVGQPRDGITLASWGMLDTDLNRWELKRTDFNKQLVVELLTKMNWNSRAVDALYKNKSGQL